VTEEMTRYYARRAAGYKNFFDAAALRDALGRRARDLVFEGCAASGWRPGR